jgi:uncharacterized protein (TIGR02145 family)
MKRILFILLIFVFAQNVFGQGINFQGVARSANGTILANQKISLKLSIITGSNTSTPDYIEIRSVATNTQGIFSVVVGDTGTISTIGIYASISWKTSSKFLKVEMDPNNGINFISMGTTPLQYVPFSYYSNGVDAANVAGILPVKSGGTGVASISDLKVALVLDKVNNTSDLNKPISTLTQTALDLKLNAADTSKYTKQTYSDSALVAKQVLIGLKLNAADTSKYTKQTYIDSSLLTKLKISDTTAMLSSRIARDTLSLSNRIDLKLNTNAVFLPTIVIGTQQWMRENLDVVTYRNGDVIPQVTDQTTWAGLTTGAWCYYNNEAANGAIYGKLYNWYAVNDSRGLAPQGWHIPSDAEWTTLSTLLGGEAAAGGKMKSTGITRWTTPNTSATNESGFTGLPGGYRYLDGVSSFNTPDGSKGRWWSTTESDSTNGWSHWLSYISGKLNRNYGEKKNGYSVRCIRD